MAKYKNLPELMNLFRHTADIQTADMLNLPTPELETGKPIVIDVEASPAQKEFVKVLVDLSKRVAEGEFSDGSYNNLCITNDGRMGALDMRCIDKEKFAKLGYEIDTSDFEHSKVNACVNEVYKTYKETEKDRLTQLIFCDVSTPKNGEKFSVYDDIKAKLIEKGVLESEIAFIHDPKNDKDKETLFRKMRSGEMRILIGSTAKMGAGTNIQKKLIELHRIDCPYRPRDLEQSDGRILRRGNENKIVRIKRYVTKGTFDSYLWQIVENKQRFISQVMTGNTPARTFDDKDTSTLNYAEIKAIATGNPLIKRKMEIENRISDLRALEQYHMRDKFNMEYQATKVLPQRIAEAKSDISGLERDIVTRNQKTQVNFSMQLGKNTYDSESKAKAGELIYKATLNSKYHGVEIGEYRGFKIIPYREKMFSETKICLSGANSTLVDVSASGNGNIQRLDNAINAFDKELIETQEHLRKLEQQLETAKTQAKEPFEQEYELKTLLSELTEVDSQLDLDKEDNSTLIQEKEDKELDEILVMEEMEEVEYEMV